MPIYDPTAREQFRRAAAGRSLRSSSVDSGCGSSLASTAVRRRSSVKPFSATGRDQKEPPKRRRASLAPSSQESSILSNHTKMSPWLDFPQTPSSVQQSSRTPTPPQSLKADEQISLVECGLSENDPHDQSNPDHVQQHSVRIPSVSDCVFEAEQMHSIPFKPVRGRSFSPRIETVHELDLLDNESRDLLESYMGNEPGDVRVSDDNDNHKYTDRYIYAY